MISRGVALGLLLAIAGSCSSSEPARDPSEPVEGLVSSLEGRGDQITALTVQDADGPVQIKIASDRDYGFDLSHLEEHRRLKQPVRVTLELRGDDLYAVQIDDA